jgi:hypothetical protein
MRPVRAERRCQNHHYPGGIPLDADVANQSKIQNGITQFRVGDSSEVLNQVVVKMRVGLSTYHCGDAVEFFHYSNSTT